MKHLLLLTLLAIAGFVRAQTTREPLFTSFDGTQLHYDVLGEGNPQELVDAVPGARLMIVPGTHGGAMSTPEFARAVVGFLKK